MNAGDTVHFPTANGKDISFTATQTLSSQASSKKLSAKQLEKAIEALKQAQQPNYIPYQWMTQTWEKEMIKQMLNASGSWKGSPIFKIEYEHESGCICPECLTKPNEKLK